MLAHGVFVHIHLFIIHLNYFFLFKSIHLVQCFLASIYPPISSVNPSISICPSISYSFCSHPSISCSGDSHHPSLHIPTIHLICPSIHLSFHPSIHMSIHFMQWWFTSSIPPYTNHPFNLSIHPSIHPSICPSISCSFCSHPSISCSADSHHPSIH